MPEFPPKRKIVKMGGPLNKRYPRAGTYGKEEAMTGHTPLPRDKAKTRVVGTRTVEVPGKVIQKGGSTTTMSTELGKYTPPKYTPATRETGDPRYGAVRKPNKPLTEHGKEVDRIVSEGQRKKQDIVYDSEGRSFRTGFTEHTPRTSSFTTKTKIKPTLRTAPTTKEVPIIERKLTSGKNKQRGITTGGSDRHGNPQTKYGTAGARGSRTKVRIFKRK